MYFAYNDMKIRRNSEEAIQCLFETLRYDARLTFICPEKTWDSVTMDSNSTLINYDFPIGYP